MNFQVLQSSSYSVLMFVVNQSNSLQLRMRFNITRPHNLCLRLHYQMTKKRHSLSHQQTSTVSSKKTKIIRKRKKLSTFINTKTISEQEQERDQADSNQHIIHPQGSKEAAEIQENQSHGGVPGKAEAVEDQGEELIPLGQDQNEVDSKPAWYFSEKTFSEFPLSEPTLKALQKNNFERMTHIQARTLPLLLKGKDVLGSAKTGSGKTLAYLIPCLEKLRELEFRQKNGTGVIVILPTRELAIQVFNVAKLMGELHNRTIGLLIGGMNRKMESSRLEKGVNLLICTPGRLLDHLQNSNFIYHNMFCLVIDEADALLRIGFEQEISDILKVLPAKRQTILFSATQTKKIDDLAKLSLKDPLYVGVDDFGTTATVENLEQGFVVIAAHSKFRLLETFLRKQLSKKKKIMVFFSSCNSVKFYSDLLNFIDIRVMDIHGKQKQQKRSTTFFEFGQEKEGVLLCTDVAARGLDIPEVDWIVQYDPPLDIREYIHRVGRTCRGHSSRGKALLLLIKEQRSYLQHLLQAKVQLNEYEFEQDKLDDIQEEFEMLVNRNNYLHSEATQAYKSFLHAYTTYSLKDVFNVHSLDLRAVGRSFGLTKVTYFDLNVKLGGSKIKRIQQASRRNNLSAFRHTSRN